MNEFIKDMEKPSKSQGKPTEKDKQMTSFWESLSTGAKNLFRQMFSSSDSYTPLDSDETQHRLFSFFFFSFLLARDLVYSKWQVLRWHWVR